MSKADERRRARRRQHAGAARDRTGPAPDRQAPSALDVNHHRSVVVRIVTAVACTVGAQVVHWSVIDEHADEWRAAGTFFLVLALAEGLLTMLILGRLTRRVAAAGIAISAVPIVIWAWDRAVGLPFGPTKGVRGTIGRSDVLSVLFEVLTIVALWPFLRPGFAQRRQLPLDTIGKVVVGATAAYVVGFTYWAILGDTEAIHGEATASTFASATSTTTADATPSTELVPTQTITYVGTEYRFDGPTTAPAAATRFELRNDGVEGHELVIARIPDTTPTPAEPAKLQELFADAQFGLDGAPEIIGETHTVEAGATGDVVVDLTPGRYLLSCAIGAPNGSYHYVQGMLGVLTVT